MGQEKELADGFADRSGLLSGNCMGALRSWQIVEPKASLSMSVPKLQYFVLVRLGYPQSIPMQAQEPLDVCDVRPILVLATIVPRDVITGIVGLAPSHSRDFRQRQAVHVVCESKIRYSQHVRMQALLLRCS